MNRFRIVTIAVCLCLPLLAVAQQPAPQEKSGLKVGEKAPDFRLKDQTGQERSRDELGTGVDYVALVFYRSASW